MTFAHVPNALGFETQEQIEAGLEVLALCVADALIGPGGAVCDD